MEPIQQVRRRHLRRVIGDGHTSCGVVGAHPLSVRHSLELSRQMPELPLTWRRVDANAQAPRNSMRYFGAWLTGQLTHARRSPGAPDGDGDLPWASFPGGTRVAAIT